MRFNLVFLTLLLISSSMVCASSPIAEAPSTAPPKRCLTVKLSALTGIDNGTYVLNKGFNLIVDWRWSKRFRLGLGSGLEKFDEYVIPVFAHTAIPLGESIHSPFIYAKAGYGIGFASEEAGWYDSGFLGGILLSGGVNLTLFSWDRLALRAGLGYRFQRIAGKLQDAWAGRRILEYGRMDFHLALSFW